MAKTNPNHLALNEMMVWAAAFAQSSNETNGDEHQNRASEAVKAAWRAVDLLRAGQDLIALGQRQYEAEKIAFNNDLSRGIKAAAATQVKHKDTPAEAVQMLRAFLVSDGESA